MGQRSDKVQCVGPAVVVELFQDAAEKELPRTEGGQSRIVADLVGEIDALGAESVHEGQHPVVQSQRGRLQLTPAGQLLGLTDEEPEHPGRGNGLDHKPDRPNKPDKPRRKAFNTDNLSSNTSIYDPMPQEYELLRSGFLSDEPDAVDVLVDIGVELSEPPTAQIEMANVDQNNQAETDSLVKDRSVLSKVSERRTDWFRRDEETVRSVDMAELLRPNHISPK